MGISDEDYANAIRQSAKKIKINELHATTAVQMPYGHFKVLAEQDLHHEAMKAPLSALIDMWLARWQGEWVNETNFQEDDFWRITLVRLTGANKLEKHNLATQMSPVYRIIE
jgi:hypothetical protein